MTCLLVVEDDQDLREALAAVLERVGYAVRQASNGLEALRVAREVRAEAILLDLEMPVLDGREFLERRAGIPSLAAVPVVLTSGLVDEVLSLAGQYARVYALPKPFQAAALRAAVARALRSQAQGGRPAHEVAGVGAKSGRAPSVP